MDDPCMVKIGPPAAQLGNQWDEKGHTEIVQIFISHDEDRIRSIQFQYKENETLFSSPQYGVLSKNNFDVIKLKYPHEYITSINGRTTYTGDLSSLSIYTNERTHGPFGKRDLKDKEFHYSLGEDNQFGGFHGSVFSGYVSSLGVYFKPVTTLDAQSSKNMPVSGDCAEGISNIPI